MQAGSFSSYLANPYGFAIYFVTLWCAACFVISLVSGWFRLASSFRRESDPLGKTRNVGPMFYGVSMRFWTNYNGVIRLSAADDALYLSVFFLFRVGHPPLRVPWGEIQIEKKKFLFQTYVLLTLGNRDRIPMRISKRMARNLGILDQTSANELTLPVISR